MENEKYAYEWFFLKAITLQQGEPIIYTQKNMHLFGKTITHVNWKYNFETKASIKGTSWWQNTIKGDKMPITSRIKKIFPLEPTTLIRIVKYILLYVQ